MSDDENYSSGSDEDYVPSDGEAVSEEEHSGEEEDLSALHAEADLDDTGGGQGQKRKKSKRNTLPARKRKGGIKLDEEEVVDNGKDEYTEILQKQIEEEKESKKEELEKKRADDLWSSFLSDVGTKPKPKPLPSIPPHSKSSICSPVSKVDNSVSSSTSTTGKVTITKEFDFAGEVVRVTEDVDVNSKEGQKQMKKLTENPNEASESTSKSLEKLTPSSSITVQKPSPGISPLGVKKPGGGLGSVLNRINRKDKISTLEKSKLDWENFKSKEGITEELQIHNRGKDGYIEKMQFLNRTDQRQFEIERDLRLSSSSKR